MNVDRRAFLLLAGTALLGPLVGCSDQRTDRLVLKDGLATLAQSFGQRFLDDSGVAPSDEEPHQLELVRTGRGIEVRDRATFLVAFRDAVHAGFLDARIVAVDGWQVSQTKARLAALSID
jgi:hypothetical protein